MKALCIALTFCVVWPIAARAQSLPEWTFEVAAGRGPRTDHAGSTWYRGSSSFVSRLAVGYRLGGPARTALYLSGELTPDLDKGDELTVCGRAPDGTCYRDFATITGVAGAVTLHHAWNQYVVSGVALGGGNYNDHLTGYGEMHLTLTDATHVGLNLSARYMRWTAGGNRYWFAPITAGVQIF